MCTNGAVYLHICMNMLAHEWRVLLILYIWGGLVHTNSAMYLHICMNMLAHEWRLEDNVRCLFFPSAPHSLRQGLSLNLQFTDSASLGDQQAPGMHMIPPPWDHRCSLLTFMCVLGIQIRVLVLVEKALPQKSPFLSTLIFYFDLVFPFIYFSPAKIFNHGFHFHFSGRYGFPLVNVS